MGAHAKGLREAPFPSLLQSGNNHEAAAAVGRSVDGALKSRPIVMNPIAKRSEIQGIKRPPAGGRDIADRRQSGRAKA